MLTNSDNQNSFEKKNIIIMILLLLLFLTFLGINLLTSTDSLLKKINNTFGPIIKKIVAFIGASIGNIINTLNNIFTNTAKIGIDVGSGAVNNVGDLFIKTTKESFDIDNKVNNSRIKLNEPEADNTGNPIQNSISSNKNSLLKNNLNYIDIKNENQLITTKKSGQKMSLNPTFSP
jgi:tetrahydromethanopterin S-methyltransferase subunit H